VNSAASLAVGLPVGRLARVTLAVTVYAVPAVAVWAVLGIGLGALPLARPALVLAIGYAACYGVNETAAFRRLRPPGSSWQVPQAMVMNVPRWRRVLVWGSILGPGFLTRNPYAGFGLLPLVVASVGRPAAAAGLAAVIGLAHGTGRALALLRDARPDAAADPMRLVLTSMRWRTFDGFALLVIAGAAAVAWAGQF
jgi:hypothetical protein